MQSNGNSKRLVVMGSALKTGKNSAVNLARKFFFGKYHRSSWSAKRLMGGGGHHIRVRKRRRIHTPSNKTGEMRHIHHNKRSDTLGNFIEFLKIDNARICCISCNNKLRLLSSCETEYGFIIKPVSFLINCILRHFPRF